MTDNSLLNCIDCNFISNDVRQSATGGRGGAISLTKRSVLKGCLNCKFVDNGARLGGSIFLTENSVFSDCMYCLFENNTGFE